MWMCVKLTAETNALAGESLPSTGHKWSQTWLFCSDIWPKGGVESEDSPSPSHCQVAWDQWFVRAARCSARLTAHPTLLTFIVFLFSCWTCYCGLKSYYQLGSLWMHAEAFLIRYYKNAVFSSFFFEQKELTVEMLRRLLTVTAP